jgi:hypothetical protein
VYWQPLQHRHLPLRMAAIITMTTMITTIIASIGTIGARMAIGIGIMDLPTYLLMDLTTVMHLAAGQFLE